MIRMFVIVVIERVHMIIKTIRLIRINIVVLNMIQIIEMVIRIQMI